MEQDSRNEEDKIIDAMVIEGARKMFDDSDFLPSRLSLYQVQTVIPDYDDEIFHRVVWNRPHSFCDRPEYFVTSAAHNTISCQQGTLPDETFLGALIGVAVYPGHDLLENIFASRPTDFKKYGVYTCRFYVEGEWVDVTTDTNIPCVRDEVTGVLGPVYSHSLNPNELWIAFAEKAYAKAVGSYEAIPKVKIQEALQHLTGGSVQQLALHDESNKELTAVSGAYKILSRHIKNETILLLLPSGKAATDEALSKSKGKGKVEAFLQNRLYSVVACREINGFELFLLHNPWTAKGTTGLNRPECPWMGQWSDDSEDWDMYPEIQQEFENDPGIPWRRKKPNGYFWMSSKMILKHFGTLYTCKLFPSHRFNFYLMRGEWRGASAAGAIHTVRDKAKVVADAIVSRQTAHQKATAAVVIDGDSSWFNNPQYRIIGSKACSLYVSVVAIAGDLGTGGGHSDGPPPVAVTITSLPKSAQFLAHSHLWESSLVETVATTRPDLRQKGMESSIWNVRIEADRYYHVVVHTTKRQEGEFIVRLFTSERVAVESIPAIKPKRLEGVWTKAGDLDSTGGPFTLTVEDHLKENTKWVQNPQFHVEVTDAYSQEELFLKVILRRVEKSGFPMTPGAATPSAALASTDATVQDVRVGLAVCKAECLEDNSNTRKKNQPKQNALGERVQKRVSTLLSRISVAAASAGGQEHPAGPTTETVTAARTFMRVTNVTEDMYFCQSSYSDKTEACVLFPKVPRSWMPNGLIVIPSLSEKGLRGAFELEVYASEPVTLRQLPDSCSRSIAGEWVTGQAGGSHLCPTWKKNPRYVLHLRTARHNRDKGLIAHKMRITLLRSGKNWRNMVKKDAVGAMIGFYIFISPKGITEQRLVYESIFVPSDQLSTDPSFELSLLGSDEDYVIMPTTYSENKLGAFVLSILSDNDFTIRKEK